MTPRPFTPTWWRAVGWRFARAGVVCAIATALLTLEPAVTLAGWCVSAAIVGTAEIGRWLLDWIDDGEL